MSGESTRARLAPTGDLSWPAIAAPAVAAEVHSDDHERSATFNASPWLDQATDEEIVALGRQEWCNSYEADAVARFFEERAAVGEVFSYLEDRRGLDGEQIGFECSLDPQDVEAWLASERPHLKAWLDEECSFATPHYQVAAGEFISDELGGSQGLEWEIRDATGSALETLYESDGATEEDAIARARDLEAARS